MADPFYVQALYAYSGVDTSSLSFEQGDIIEVLSTLASGWWDGVICEQKIRGWFPSNYVQRISDDEAAWAKQEMANWWDATDPDQSDGQSSPLNGLALATNNDQSQATTSHEPSPSTFHSNHSQQTSIDASRLPTSIFNTRHSRDPSVDTKDSAAEEDFWVPKVTSDGRVFYYNTRTSETSRDMPLGGQGDGVVISPSDFAPHESETVEIPITGSDDLASAAVVSRRDSNYSDDSALDVDFAPDRKTQLRRVESPREAIVVVDPLTSVANSLLLSLTPLPLVTDLETRVSESLQILISCVGIGGLRLLEREEESDAGARRDQLASVGDSVVLAVRTLLHGTGVLDNPSLDMPSALNEIMGPFDRSPVLPSYALVELRPHTRRVTSTLSKLVLSIRAVWGLLETIAADQEVDAILSTAEREAKLDAFAAVRETRLTIEAKLRAEVLAGARDVQSHVDLFLTEFERHLSPLADGSLNDRNTVRMLKNDIGTLQTTAALIMLPGGGFGGNWRGQGFVELPSSHATTNLESLMSAAAVGGSVGLSALSYAYPSTPLSNENVKALVLEAQDLLDDAESLKSAVVLLSSTSPPTVASHARTISSSSRTSSRTRPLSTSSARRPDVSSTMLLNLSSKLIGHLSDFLDRIEDLDIAESVDIELHSPVFASEVGLPTAEYIKSVHEANSLLSELDISKQLVYDVAPSLLFAVQECFTPNHASSTTATAIGANPLAASPLEFAKTIGRVEYGPETLLEVIGELKIAIDRLVRTATALGRIAEIQSATPAALRKKSKAPRPRRANDATIRASRSNVQNLSTSAVSSRQSLAHTFDEDPDSPTRSTTHSRNRESADSDFFFPSISPSQSGVVSPPLTPSSTTGKSRSSKTSAMFSAIGGGWDRRESNATTASGVSDGLPFKRDPPYRDDQSSPVRSPSKMKLAKLLGTADPNASPMRSTASLPENVPVWLGADYGFDEISFNMDGQVKGGTMRALIIAAASHEGRVDSNFLSTLLMTYRTFCTSHQLLDLLIQRFQVEAPMGLVLEDMKVWETRKLRPIRARVANVLKSWVREHMDYDQFDPDLLRRIADFATTTMRDPVQSPQIIKVVEERLKGAGPRPIGNIAPGPLPASIIPRGFRKLKFIDIEPLELARQLTIMDGRLFSRITPQECLGKAWPKKYGSDAPNISAMIDLSNGVTRWVMETILAHDDAKKRANIMKHFIAVAERCLALNNFSTLIHIIAGLNSTPIHRLRRTWETLSQKSMMTLTMLSKSMRPDKNYKDYREALRGVAPPCVPFLGVYLTDWTFIGDGNPDMVREKPHQINFQKRQKASELILMIKLHQSTTYNLAPVPVLIKYLEEQLFPSEPIDQASEDQRLYEISLQREPREREDERISRLLSESGFL